MIEPTPDPASVLQHDNDISLLAFGTLLLRWRRTIVTLGLFGAVVGLAIGLLSTQVYVSEATFLPQGADGGVSEVALAASQLGIRVPTNSGEWGAPVYVELLRSRALLEQIATDSVVVEPADRRVATMDVLEIRAPNRGLRVERTVRKLEKIVAAWEEKKLGAVKLSVATRWPSVSLALAQRLVRGVNQFNLETRKSQATAERQFVEAQASEAERALRQSEDQLQAFLQRNRAIAGSPELTFQRDRLQREVELRQQVYTTLLQGREEARLREVRETPVITVLEEPRLPVIGQSRKLAQKSVIGGLAAGILGLLIAFLSQGIAGARRLPSGEAQRFFQLLEDATPQFLRRRRS